MFSVFEIRALNLLQELLLSMTGVHVICGQRVSKES